MSESARTLAEFASFQAFINCYLREIDPGVWWEVPDWIRHTNIGGWLGDQILVLSPPGIKSSYALDVSYRSAVGRHRILGVYRKEGQSWIKESFWGVLLSLVRDLYGHHHLVEESQAKRKQFELTYRLTDSLQNMSRYIDYWQQRPRELLHFIDTEQAIVFGHWLHPTPKSRQGCHNWQQPLFSPELQGQFQLYLFGVDRSLLLQNSDLEQSAECIVRSLFAEDVKHLKASEAPIPVHPLQAQWLMYQPSLKLLLEHGLVRNLGQRGPWFTATASMRTVYNAELDWMLKLSIPVKLTNSMRQNKVHELDAGVLISRLLRLLGVAGQWPQFRMIDDPAWIGLAIPGRPESGFECIIRHNPFASVRRQDAMSIAYLTQDGLDASELSPLATIIRRLAGQRGATVTEAALEWFNRYWDCVIEPCIQLFDTHGIALEAHQQNILLDLTEGVPRFGYYRDNQGFYLCADRRPQLIRVLPALDAAVDLFYDTEEILHRFGYYLIVNQLFAVMGRLGCDSLVSEQSLLRLTIYRLHSLLPKVGDLGGRFIRYLLTNDTLACKANLLTRVKDIDELEAELELAVYVHAPNPIAASAVAGNVERAVEYA